MKKHANQVAAWDKVLGLCNDKGGSYKPSNPSMNSTALKKLLEDSQKSIKTVQDAKNDLVTAVNQRHRAFDQLPIIGTRIIGALSATGAPSDHVADVNRIRQRFRFQPPLRSSAFKKNSGGQTEQIQGTGAPSASIPGRLSQLDFESKIQNFAELIGLLGNDSPYMPNEASLKIEALNSMLEDLRKKHDAAEHAKSTLSEVRRTRNRLLFGSDGIYGRAKKVKDYFKSVFGARDQEYMEIRKIKIVKQ
jgi:hypothetical protein